MKRFFLPAALLLSVAASAQYYYKDVLGARESSDLFKSYIKNKVSRVLLTSYDAGNQKDEEFYVEQQFSLANRALVTLTRSQNTEPSRLVSYADEGGNIIRTVDSSGVTSITTYAYNAAGQLQSILTSTGDSTTGLQVEQHLWEWKNTSPVRMLRIKNGRDTAFVNFELDEHGNVTSETETRRGVTSEPVYYYYNDNGRLTDVVRYSKRAGRLLPEYMFEWNENGYMSQKITVPATNSQYLLWRYQYSGRGLKTKEVIYNRQKKLTGKIEYQYTFGS